MKTLNLKSAFTSTFKKGTATSRELAIVFITIALPTMIALFIFGHFPKF